MTNFRIALVGAPNAGKTTLFNGLTGGRAKVANYPGVTVESKIGKFTTPAGQSIQLIDLPGVYGLSARSLDERVTHDVLSGKIANQPQPDAMIVVVDAANLRTHLHSVLQLKSLGLPMIVALNMIDLAERDGLVLDVAALEESLGVPVVATCAPRAKGREALLARLDAELGGFVASAAPVQEVADDLSSLQREARSIINRVVLSDAPMNRLTRAIDGIILNHVMGPLVLAGILFFMFQAVYAWSAWPMEMIEGGAAALGAYIGELMPDIWLRGLLIDGVIAGVGSVVVFLPQIIILFAFILALEASGYMARAAFLMDELMLRVGLNGRAFIPLLSSFACAIPGIMAARTIENERDRLTTILVAPLMTCSARLPVYTLIIGAFIQPTNVGPSINRDWFCLDCIWQELSVPLPWRRF